MLKPLSIMLLACIFLLATPALAQQSLAIHAFESEDIYTGVAIADSLRYSLSPEDDAMVLWGLLETGGLQPPLPVAEGYLPPLRGLQESGNSLNGARMLQQILNMDVLVSGKVNVIHQEETTDDDAGVMVELELFIATHTGSETLHFTGSSNDLAALIFEVAQALSDRFAVQAKRPEDFVLEGSYAEYIRLLALFDGGFVQEASDELKVFAEDHGEDYPFTLRLQQALEAIEAGQYGEEVLLSAMLSSKMLNIEKQRRILYFERLADLSDLPIYDLWVAILRDENNDRLGANRAFADASQGYAYAQAVEASYRSARKLEGAEALLERAETAPQNFSSLWAWSYAAQNLGFSAQEKLFLEHMKDNAPSIVYPFQRLSFMAFDEKDAQAAAENLRLALELRPESDLYWTNYGWAQYLLGDYEGSATSSFKATEIDPTQVTAYYNLGLSHAVRGNFEDAMLAYDIAVRVNPVIDEAALADLEQAERDFPEQAVVQFALGNLYELQGKSEAANQRFARFLELAPEDLNTSEAERRIEQLSQAPAAFRIREGSLELQLAGQPLASDALQAGDRIYPSFHVQTEGYELPRSLVVSYQLAALSLSQQITIPANVVAYDISQTFIDIPSDMPAGDYILQLTLRSSDGREAAASLAMTLGKQAGMVRQLLARGVSLRTLENWQPFYSLEDSENSKADAKVKKALLEELAATAELAKENLPVAETGRFAELNGQEIFEQSTAEDIDNFLLFLIATSNESLDIAFVDAYAQWVLAGAPEQP